MTIKFRKRAYEYPVVEELPAGALAVRAFADKIGLSTHSQVYKLHREGKLEKRGGKIVMFQGVNFVIPVTPEPEPEEQK